MDGPVNHSTIEKFVRPSYYKKQLGLERKYVSLAPQAYFAFLKFIDVSKYLI